MKKMFLFVLSLMSCITLFNNNFTKINAEEENITDTGFQNTIEVTDLYRQYSIYEPVVAVDRVANTEDGIRYTVSYIFNDYPEEYGNTTLVYIGDKDFNILETLLITTTDKSIFVNDLLRDEKTRINSAKGPVYQCDKKTCIAWQYEPNFVNAPGCSAIVGQPCSLTAILGKPYVKVLCKALVFIACVSTMGKKCLNYFEEPSVCSL